MTPIQEMIASHPLLADIDPRFEHLFFESAEFKRYNEGDIIFREGQAAECFYLINRGRIVLEAALPGGRNCIIQTLFSRDPLGWSWLFPPYIWHFTARVMEPSDLIALNAALLRERINENPTFGRDLIMRISKILFERLQSTRRQLIGHRVQGTSTEALG